MKRTLTYFLFFVTVLTPISAEKITVYVETATSISLGKPKALPANYWQEYSLTHGVEYSTSRISYGLRFTGKQKYPVSAVEGLLLRQYTSFSLYATIDYAVSKSLFIGVNTGMSLGQYSYTETYFFYPSANVTLSYALPYIVSNNSDVRLVFPFNLEFQRGYSFIGGIGFGLSLRYTF